MVHVMVNICVANCPKIEKVQQVRGRCRYVPTRLRGTLHNVARLKLMRRAVIVILKMFYSLGNS